MSPEFPNDNASLHEGAVWTCLTTTGEPRAVLRWAPQANPPLPPRPRGARSLAGSPVSEQGTAPHGLPSLTPRSRARQARAAWVPSVLPPLVRDSVGNFEHALASAPSTWPDACSAKSPPAEPLDPARAHTCDARRLDEDPFVLELARLIEPLLLE